METEGIGKNRKESSEVACIEERRAREMPERRDGLPSIILLGGLAPPVATHREHVGIGPCRVGACEESEGTRKNEKESEWMRRNEKE